MAAAANAPVRLDGAHHVWFVEQGALDVFCSERSDGRVVAAAKHLLRAEAGRLVFGMPELDGPFAVLAKGVVGTRLRRLDTATVRAQAIDGHGVLFTEIARQADLWVGDLAHAVTADIESRPRATRLIEAGSAEEISADCVLSVRPAEVVWVSPEQENTAFPASYLGTETLSRSADEGPIWFPLTAQSWVTLSAADSGAHPDAAVLIRTGTAEQLARSGELLGALGDFARLALDAEALNRRLRIVDEVNARSARSAQSRTVRERARAALDSLGGTARPAPTPHDSALMAVLSLIGGHSGIEFSEPRRPATAPPPTLEEIVVASGLRARRVRLAPEDRWWRSDSGAMLGYTQQGSEPVALLPGLTGYRAVRADGSATRVSAASAGEFMPSAWIVYPKFDDSEPVRLRDLVRLTRHGVGTDLIRIAAAGLVAALLTQAPAIALGMLTDWALPFARTEALVGILAALAVFTVGAAVLSVFGGVTLMRLEARIGARLSAAAWDRLLALPLPFFRDAVAGELAVRMATFQRLRDLFSGVVASVLSSVVFLLPTLGLLYFYDSFLASIAVAMTAVSLVVIAGLGLAQMPHQRRWHEAVRVLSGRLFQFIGGVAKIRSCGAEAATFASWAGAYRDKQLAEIRSSRIDEHSVAFGTAFPFAFAAVLCAAALVRGDAVAAGDFVVALAASLTLYVAVADLGRAMEALAEAFTSYEQIRPVLASMPERDASTLAPVRLDGEVVVDRVSFRFDADSPLVLDEVCVEARPGEFIALVGGSGAGKSTLVRLMLGLETPERGAVYFDGRDLSNLDRRSVRRQIGVVPQDSSLQPGSLAENIIGMSEDLKLEDAWQAARLAAVDADIADMPMQMMTMVGDRSSIFSGGQIQRIRIAAALVRDPRIVILDEATSWLDARSQAEVMSSIEALGATRIVVAHRLSTIRRADRIYVLDAGQLVQSGGFDELLDETGPFRELVQRQLL